MKVIINEKEYDYVSDYPNGWSFIAKDYFKFPVQIGKHKCFIKRFETKRLENVPGWDLMMKLRWKNEPNLPRVYDIVTVEENRRDVHYVFQEHLKGSTLEGFIKAGGSPDISRLADDVLNGLQSIHRQEYWFADFCEKNIFCTESGKFYLIDLDSCVPASEPLTNDLPVNMVYWALIFKFYKEVLQNKELRLGDIPATKLNYLQQVFLVLHLKIYALRQEEDYMSDQAFNELPRYLDQVHPSFRALFKRFAEEAETLQDEEAARHVRSVINENILPLTSWPPDIRPEEIQIISEQEAQKSITPPPRKYPQITVFKASDKVVNKGESYVLNWEVRDAKDVQLYKNGKLFYKPGSKTKSIAITEPYDAAESSVKFLLKATNEEGEVTSEPLTIQLRDTFKIVEEDTGRKVKPGLKRMRRLISILLVVLVASVAGYLLFNRTKESVQPVVISGFMPSSVNEGSFLLISGENFPADRGEVLVFFDKRPGQIQYISNELISVIVPRVPFIRRSGIAKVKVSVVYKGDTSVARGTLTVLRRRVN